MEDNKIWSVGASYPIAKDLGLTAIYMNSDQEGKNDKDDDGYVIGLNYKGAKAAVAGSWGLYAKYYDQASTTILAHTMNATIGTDGIKGYMVGAKYAVAKNIVAGIEYFDLDAKDDAETSLKQLYAELNFLF